MFNRGRRDMLETHPVLGFQLQLRRNHLRSTRLQRAALCLHCRGLVRGARRGVQRCGVVSGNEGALPRVRRQLRGEPAAADG